MSLNANSYEISFQAYCKSGGASGKGKKVVQPLMPSLKICHTLWEDDDETEKGIEVDDVVMSVNVLACGKHISVDDNLEDMDEDKDPFGVKKNLKEI